MGTLIHDVTLRDGNHALRHQLSSKQVRQYARKAFAAGIRSIEVGHGNGLGGSSSLIGFSSESDTDLIEALASEAPFERVGVHSMPSFATKMRDLAPAIEAGANYFRLGAHCTEVDTIKQHADFLRGRGVQVSLAIMMISHASIGKLVEQIGLAVDFGIPEVVLMDSVGRLTPRDVTELVLAVNQAFPETAIGFHAHDNLGSAVANSLAALDSGAQFVDASILGMGAGAGNASLESLICALQLLGEVDFKLQVEGFLRLADEARGIGFIQPVRTALSSATAMANMFSGFAPFLMSLATEYEIDAISLAMACIGKKLVAGQEDSLLQVAAELADQK